MKDKLPARHTLVQQLPIENAKSNLCLKKLRSFPNRTPVKLHDMYQSRIHVRLDLNSFSNGDCNQLHWKLEEKSLTLCSSFHDTLF